MGNVFGAVFPARYITCTLPKRLGGGDIVMRELTTAEALSSESDADRAQLAIESFRGMKLPVGVEREEWWRAQRPAVIKLVVNTTATFNAYTPHEDEAIERSHRCVDDEYSWTLPEGHTFSLRELTFGQVEDTLASARAAKKKSMVVELVARACNVESDALGRLPARIGTTILSAYNRVHSASEEEEAGFFGEAAISTSPPKAM